MIYYAIRVDEGNRPLITKLNEGIEIDAKDGQYILFTQDPVSLDFNAYVLDEVDFFLNFPHAEKDVWLQRVA